MPRPPQLIALGRHLDERGLLCFAESPLLPFQVARAYWFTDLPRGGIRGNHGHRRLEQLICCLHGEVRIDVHDGEAWHTFLLDSPDEALHVPPSAWRRIEGVAERSTCLVLASHPYEPDDYLHDFEEFMTLAAHRSGDSPR